MSAILCCRGIGGTGISILDKSLIEIESSLLVLRDNMVMRCSNLELLSKADSTAGRILSLGRAIIRLADTMAPAVRASTSATLNAVPFDVSKTSPTLACRERRASESDNLTVDSALKSGRS